LVIWPYYEAIVWGTVVAIVFAPLYRRLRQAMRQKRNLAALASVLIILAIVILPLMLIASSLLQEASSLYDTITSGELNFGEYFQRILSALPTWATELLDRYGMTDFTIVQERLSAGLTKASQALATRALNVGQSTFDFIVSLGIMLYLLFFLLRDGEVLSRRIVQAVPIHAEERRALFSTFTMVIRATVKGSVLVAVAQGALGGLIFWFLGVHAPLLWAVLMAFLSLLPAVGAALVWLPVAIYFLVTGAAWQGVILIAYGVLVIGLVDNVLRPILVGQDTKMPDYFVLISTLGGLRFLAPPGLSSVR
jgi:predicted PurR-regulated permease PerM